MKKKRTTKRRGSSRDSKRETRALEALYSNGIAAQSAMRQALQSTEQACRNLKEICALIGIKHSAAVDAEAAQRAARRSAMSLSELMRIIEHGVNARAT